MIGENISEMFRKVSEFIEIYFRWFRSFENVSKNRSCRDDSLDPKIVEIGAVLAFFWWFDFYSEKKHLPGLRTT